MDLSQFPERFRARVLSSVVRNMRAGITIRLGKLEGEILPLTIRQIEGKAAPILPASELEAKARAEFAALPYQLNIRVGE